MNQKFWNAGRQVFTRAGVLGILASASAVSAQAVANPSFETVETICGTQTAFGEWGEDANIIVATENGITPAHGSRMLRLSVVENSGSGASCMGSATVGTSEATQLVDVSSVPDAGLLEIEAFFNTINGASQRGFACEIRFHSGAASAYPANLLPQSVSQNLNADADYRTWERCRASIAKPVGASFAEIRLSATHTAGAVAHYVDSVSLRNIRCGDARVSAAEQCDDGNTTSGDGCSDTCQEELGWVCTSGFSATGLNNIGGLLAAGAVDPHWRWAFDLAGTNSSQVITVNSYSAWSPPSGDARYASTSATYGDEVSAPGSNNLYFFQDFFVPPSVASSILIPVTGSFDNAGEFYINGVSISPEFGGFTNTWTWEIPASALVAGQNRFTVRLYEAGPGSPRGFYISTGGVEMLSNCVPGCNTAGECNDNNSCTTDTCQNMACVNTTVAAGTSCSGGICNGLSADPMCVQCLNNTQCGGQTPFCNTTSNQCVACLNDAACGGATPFCDTAANQCVACLNNTQCNDGNDCTSDSCASNHVCTTSPVAAGTSCATGVCSGASAMCVQCVSFAQCSSNNAPTCNTTSNLCVGCDADHGAFGNACPTALLPLCFLSGASAGSCGVCTSNNDCVGNPNGTTCNTQTGACGRECTLDAECGNTSWCTDAGICSPKVANDQAIPSAAPANGICSPTIAQRVCSSGLCSVSDNRCGLPLFEACSGNDVSCRSGICNGQSLCSTCRTDSECGASNSGRVCSETTLACADGCRGTGGNTCPLDNICSSNDSTVGQCSMIVPDAGMPDGGMPDGGMPDAGMPEVGTDAGTVDSSLPDAQQPDIGVIMRDSGSDAGLDAGSVPTTGGLSGSGLCSFAAGKSESDWQYSFGLVALGLALASRRKR